MLLMLLMAGGMTVQAAAPDVVSTATVVSGGRWVKSGNEVKYQYKNGKYAVNVWHKISSYLYYFDQKGYRKSGWFQYNDNQYCANSLGKVYYSKLITYQNNQYFLKANAIMAKNQFVKLGTNYYFFAPSGKMLKNRLVYCNKKYYFVNSTGARIKSMWVKLSGQKYYFGADGARMQSTWVKSGGDYLYLQADGTIARNKWVGLYYVDQNGRRKRDCVIDGYYLDHNGKRTIKIFKGKYLFVGDSRTVGMKAAVPRSDTLYLGEVGVGLNWVENTISEKLYYYMKFNPDMTVIFALGVNDYGNMTKYLTYYNKVIKVNPRAKIRFMAVNPVNEKLAEKNNMFVKNSKIEAFNAMLKGAYGSKFIDTYTYLKKDGFNSRDGVHYTADTYVKLYWYVINKINKNS